MDSISISRSGTESAVTGLVNRIQTHIIEGSKTAGDSIINSIEHSAGDFIAALEEEVGEEVKMMNSVGELLISIAEYILSAAVAFSEVDDSYQTSKIK